MDALDADAVLDVGHVVLLRVASFGVSLLLAFDRLGDALDAAQPAVPGGADRGELRDGPGELGVVDLVAPLAPAGAPCTRPDAVEHAEVLGHGLAGDRQLLAERGGGAVAVGEQEVEHPAPGRVADRRPEVVVDGGGHDATATSRRVVGEARQEVVPALAVVVVLLLEHGDLPALLAEAGLGHAQQGAVAAGDSSKVTSSELPRGASSPSG